jgi:hypothetical protein
MNIMLLKSDTLAGLGMIMAIVSPFVFLVGLIIIIAFKKNRKIGIKLLIASLITFIIGFGTCFANFSLGEMH